MLRNFISSGAAREKQGYILSISTLSLVYWLLALRTTQCIFSNWVHRGLIQYHLLRARDLRVRRSHLRVGRESKDWMEVTKDSSMRKRGRVGASRKFNSFFLSIEDLLPSPEWIGQVYDGNQCKLGRA